MRMHEERVADLLSMKPGDRVLDIGCGVGVLMRAIAAHSGANIVGITINDYQVERACSHNNKAGLDRLCEVVCGNFLNMPFADNSFDAAYSIEATYHAPKLPTLLFLIISNPAFEKNPNGERQKRPRDFNFPIIHMPDLAGIDEGSCEHLHRSNKRQGKESRGGKFSNRFLVLCIERWQIVVDDAQAQKQKGQAVDAVTAQKAVDALKARPDLIQAFQMVTWTGGDVLEL